jgi:hypothetical protein
MGARGQTSLQAYSKRLVGVIGGQFVSVRRKTGRSGWGVGERVRTVCKCMQKDRQEWVGEVSEQFVSVCRKTRRSG